MTEHCEQLTTLTATRDDPTVYVHTDLPTDMTKIERDERFVVVERGDGWLRAAIDASSIEPLTLGKQKRPA